MARPNKTGKDTYYYSDLIPINAKDLQVGNNILSCYDIAIFVEMVSQGMPHIASRRIRCGNCGSLRRTAYLTIHHKIICFNCAWIRHDLHRQENYKRKQKQPNCLETALILRNNCPEYVKYRDMSLNPGITDEHRAALMQRADSELASWAWEQLVYLAGHRRASQRRKLKTLGILK